MYPTTWLTAYFGGIDSSIMDMIGHQVPFFHPAFLLFRELSENLPQMLAQLAVQDFTSKFRDENDVIFALPLW